jgi:type II secretory pathway pseudopilin PulG
MLVAAITIMLIGMAVAVPSWQYVMQDDKEQELLFRGGQIADAIQAYQKSPRSGGGLPVSLEVLVKGKFLRKAYKDPMTADGEWRFIRQVQPTGVGGVRPPSLPGGGPRVPSPSPFASPTTGSTQSGGPGSNSRTLGAFIGVASKSTQKSLRIFNNAKSYDTWQFIAGQPRIVGKAPTIGGPGLLGPSGATGRSPTPARSPTPLPPPSASQ